jgi:hypothetical protein
MNFVKIEKNQKSAPTECQLTTAMEKVGGKVSSVEGTNTERKVEYTGIVNHTKFENKLEEIAHGKKLSWSFVWGDALIRARSLAENYDIGNYYSSVLLLNSLLEATEKSLTIKINSEDLETLKTSGYRLCFAKKMDKDDYNVVWQSSQKYLSKNTFSWTPQYELFGCNSFENDVRVDVSTNVVPIGLGETSILDASGILHLPSSGGPSTSITLKNQYGEIHPGVNQTSRSSMNGGSAVSTPIYVAKAPVVSGATTLTPVEKILVWFQQNIETSTMFSSSRSQDIEIDLTSTDSATRLYSGQKWSTPLN